MLKLAQELLKIAKLLVAKKRPDTRFEQEFFDIREKIKAASKVLALRAAAKLGKEMWDEVTALGYTVISLEPKLGAFRGHNYITSCKIFVRMPQQQANKLELLLRGKYSPKFNFKSYEDGVALFNVR